MIIPKFLYNVLYHHFHVFLFLDWSYEFWAWEIWNSGMEWNGMKWNGMEWNGMVWLCTTPAQEWAGTLLASRLGVGMEQFFCTISIIYSHLPPRKESASIGSFARNLPFSGRFARAPLHSRFCVYTLTLSWIPCFNKKKNLFDKKVCRAPPPLCI